MYRGRYEGKHRKAAAPAHGKALRTGRLTTMVIATVLLLALAIGGTVAWLTANATPVENTFPPSHVACSVTENFDGTTKKNVNVTNDSDIDAYIRVKLVTYWVNEQNQHIGGTATIPTFKTGDGWIEHTDGYYYYTLPVAAGAAPETPLIGESGIALTKYTDADGGRQVVEVMAEAIQSKPTTAVTQSWGVPVGNDGNLAIE